MRRKKQSSSLQATPFATTRNGGRSDSDGFIDKHQLAAQLNLSSTRIIDAWVQKRMVSFYRLGHRTLKFSLPQVVEDLARFEIKAVGRKNK